MINCPNLVRALGVMLLMGFVLGIPTAAVAVAAFRQIARGCDEWRTAKGWLRVVLVVAGFAASIIIFGFGDCRPHMFGVSLVVCATFVWACEQLSSTGGKPRKARDEDSRKVKPGNCSEKTASCKESDSDSSPTSPLGQISL